MASYDYVCETYKKPYTEHRGMNEPQKQQTCVEDTCEGKLLRVFNAPPITFKGSGFSSTRG